MKNFTLALLIFGLVFWFFGYKTPQEQMNVRDVIIDYNSPTQEQDVFLKDAVEFIREVQQEQKYIIDNQPVPEIIINDWFVKKYEDCEYTLYDDILKMYDSHKQAKLQTDRQEQLRLSIESNNKIMHIMEELQ